MENRIRPLKSIKTKEEYEEYKKSLERYFTEYKWLKNSERPFESIMQKAAQYEEGTDARIALTKRGKLIVKGKYQTYLEQYITAYKLTIDEFEAKNENKSIFDVIKGIINNDKGTKDYLKRRYMKSRIESKAPQLLEIPDIILEDKYDVIMDVFKENEYINVPKPETSLVPIDSKLKKVYELANKVRDNYLEENGINMTKEIDTTSQLLKSKVTKDLNYKSPIKNNGIKRENDEKEI